MNRPIKKEVQSPQKQIYVPKKRKIVAAPMKAGKILIGSMEVPFNEVDEPIVVVNMA